MTDIFERFETGKWHSVNVQHTSFWSQINAARKEKALEIEERKAYAIRVVVPDYDYMDCGSLLNLAQKNELALSVNKRLCSIFSKNLATHETKDKAVAWLTTVNEKPDYGYFVVAITDYK